MRCEVRGKFPLLAYEQSQLFANFVADRAAVRLINIDTVLHGRRPVRPQANLTNDMLNGFGSNRTNLHLWSRCLNAA